MAWQWATARFSSVKTAVVVFWSESEYNVQVLAKSIQDICGKKILFTSFYLLGILEKQSWKEIARWIAHLGHKM